MNDKKFVAELAVNPANPARPWECTWCVGIGANGDLLLYGKSYPGKKHLQSHVCRIHRKGRDKVGSAEAVGQSVADEENSADEGGVALRGGTVEGGSDRSKGHVDNRPFPPWPAPIQLPQAAFTRNFRHYDNFLRPPPVAAVRHPQAAYQSNFRHHNNFLQPPPAAPLQHPQAAYAPNFQFAPMPYVHVQPPTPSNPLHIGHHPFDPQTYNRPGSNDPYSCTLCYPRRCFCGMAGIPGYGVPGPRAFTFGEA